MGSNAEQDNLREYGEGMVNLLRNMGHKCSVIKEKF
jgi:hypothetical protein